MLTLFDKYMMPAAHNGIHAWASLTDTDIKEFAQLQAKYLGAPGAALYIELGIWSTIEQVRLAMVPRSASQN